MSKGQGAQANRVHRLPEVVKVVKPDLDYFPRIAYADAVIRMDEMETRVARGQPVAYRLPCQFARGD